MTERNTAVSGENPVVFVPPVRILDRMGVHVPAIIVPEDTHRAKQAVLVPEAIHATAPGILLELYRTRDLKVRQHPAPIPVFFEHIICALTEDVSVATLAKDIADSCRKSRSRSVPLNPPQVYQL